MSANSEGTEESSHVSTNGLMFPWHVRENYHFFMFTFERLQVEGSLWSPLEIWTYLNSIQLNTEVLYAILLWQ